MAETSCAGKTVVVTGGGGGLGFGIARRFAQSGAHVVIAEGETVAGTRAAELLRTEGLSASFEPGDVHDPAQVESVVERIARARGSIEVWVNHGEVLYAGPAETYPRAWWEESLARILSGAFYASQAAGRLMLKQGRGVIVNVASVDGYRPVEGRVGFSVAHAGVIMLTQALGTEWAKRGVRVVGIAPGAIMTDPGSDASNPTTAAYARRTPLGRLGTVEEVAEAVLFLASDEASYVVAETLRADGGWVAYQLF